MDLNSVSSSYSAYTASANSTKVTSRSKTDSSKKSGNDNIAATYESSVKSDSAKIGSADRSAIIAKLKADSESRIAQMQSLVSKMFEKQGIKIGTADDMWKLLADGNFTADADTIAQAKEDISEDGYWGVKQTSDRIFDFAVALSGGDEEKMQKMVSAVEKGFKEATKSWGKELPDISNETYKSVMSKFDNWFKDNGSDVTTESILK